MNSKLKTVRKEMMAGDLKELIDLPNYDDNQRVEVSVSPAEDEEKLSPEERKAQQLAALDAFQKACAENRDDLEEFFALMDELEARRSAS